MKLSAYQSEIKRMIDQRNGYLVLSVGLLLLCLLLVILVIFLFGREKTILIPPTMGKENWVSSADASVDYYSKMTLFFAELALNVTPDNVEYAQEMVLRYVDPKSYNKIKAQFVAERDKVRNEHICAAFFPTDIKVDTKQAEAVITGDLKTFVGDTALPVKHVSYRIAYHFNAYSLHIKKFEEVKDA